MDPARPRALRLLAPVALLLLLYRAAPARADVMMQAFYWDVPSPAADSPASPWWWDKLASEARALRQSGFTAVWLPPVLKGAAGGYSVGYDPFDDYDIGSKDQQFTYPTRYGTREKLQRCAAMLRASGLNVYLDVVLNHRNGDDGSYNFRTADAYGRFGFGRFQKGFYDFHPNVPQDPNVPDYGENPALFGRDLAPVNGAGGWVRDGLIASGDWLTKALDIQGYRLDYVKGVSNDYVRQWLNSGAMAGKFAVGEFFDYDLDLVSGWVDGGTHRRSSAFDFPLRGLLRDMCNGGGYFNMARLDHAGLAGRDPFKAVTFVENHDTDRHDPVTRNKALAYAYILTSEGYPCVYYRDYSTDPGCYGLKREIDRLVRIHEKLASGGTQERWKDEDVFAYERLGGGRLLVGLNDNEFLSRTVTVDTGFGPGARLRDHTGHAPDVLTDGAGRATLSIPANGNGRGYVCYSRAAFHDRPLPTFSRPVTQEFAGATDLDIRPAERGAFVTACRVWAVGGSKVVGSLYFDASGWSESSAIRLELLDPAGVVLASESFARDTPQGGELAGAARVTGWYAFRIRSDNTPTANEHPAYWLKVSYAAPLSFAQADLSRSVRVTRSNLTQEGATDVWQGTLTVQNVGAAPIAGPLQVALIGLPEGVTLVNRAGVAGDGSPLVSTAPLTLAPGDAAILVARFRRTGPDPVTYETRAYPGAF